MTPSPDNTLLAEQLLPDWVSINAPTNPDGKRQNWPSECRPAVALALQAKDDSHAKEIADLKAEIGRLREALEPFEWAEKAHPSMRDFIDGIRISHAKIKARAAPQTDEAKP
jgi:hypothetical protein